MKQVQTNPLECLEKSAERQWDGGRREVALLTGSMEASATAPLSLMPAPPFQQQQDRREEHRLATEKQSSPQ